jgi:hypothetical protein
MNRAQQILVDTYEAGWHRGDDETELRDAYKSGDSLFTFLFNELSDEQDCDTLEAALNRMVVVTNEINEVHDAIARAYMTEDTT